MYKISYSFETKACYIIQTGFTLSIFLTLPPKPWDYRCRPFIVPGSGIYF